MWLNPHCFTGLFAVGTGPTCLSEVPVVHHTFIDSLCCVSRFLEDSAKAACGSERGGPLPSALGWICGAPQRGAPCNFPQKWIWIKTAKPRKTHENSIWIYVYIYIYKWHVFKITPNFFWPSSDRFDSFDILLICRSRRSWRRPLKWPAIAVKLGRRSWEVEPTRPLQFNEMWMEIWGNYSQVCIFGSYVFFLFVNNSLLGWVYSCRNVDSVIFLSVSRHDLYCSVDIDAFPSLYLSTSQERYKEMAG